MNLFDLLGFKSQFFWFLIIYTQYLACNQFSSCTILNSNNKASINSQQINITKQFKLNHSLDNKSTYSSLSSSNHHHFTSSLSSSASSSSSSSSSESSQTNEDILATSDVSSSLGAQIGSGGGTLMVVSDELIDNSALETRTDKIDKLDKSKLLIELTTEVNTKQTTSSLSDNLSANDVFSQEDDYLHQHLNEHIDQKLNQQLDQINSHNNLLNDYLITDLQDSKLTQSDNFKHQNDNQNYKLNNEPIIYSSSIVNRDTLDTGHAVFTPIQPPPSSSIDLSSNQQQPPLWNYPLDFSNQHLNDKSHSHSKYNTSNIKHEHVHPEIEEEPLDGHGRKHKASVVGVCKDGLVVPAWRPLYNLSTFDRVLRGIVYFLALCYLFVGVSIIADRFMGAIEVITSTERDVIIRQSNGETHVISVKIWNETVSNLTLMALGSSAPEILLSIIEVYAQNFDAGDLGPGTIVGSAAFNMFVIIAVCVWVVPCEEVKKIKHLRVYFITMIWSVFAYIWLLLILQYISEGVVEIWEGLLTFAFFPLTVLTAYIADRRLLFYKYIGKKYRANRRGMIVESEGVTSTPSHSHQKPPNSDDVELGQIVANAVNKRKSSNFLNFRNSSIIGSLTGSTNLDGGLKIFDREEDSEEVKEFEQHRREYIQILKRLRKKNPDAAMETLEYMAREEIVKQGPKSRAFYRLQATKKLTGGTPFKRHKDKNQDRKDSSSTLTAQSNQKPIKEDNVVYIYFDPAHYTVFENVGSFAVRILREGPLNCEVAVHVKTEDGTANGGSDYIEIDEDVHFARGEEIKEVFIQVIDDDIFEEDEHFYVNLSNARLIVDNSIDNTVNENSTANDVQSNGHLSKQNSLEQQIPQAHEKPLEVRLGTAANASCYRKKLYQKANATVMILDDDHSGVFSFPETEVEINEAVGLYLLKVVRNSGARGRVFLPFKVLEAGARRNIDFELADGELVFENNETWQEIPIQIIDNETYEKDAIFCVELGEPRRDDDELRTTISASPKSNLSFKEKVALQGKPRLGETRKVQVRIKESKEFKDTVDKLFQKTTTTSLIGSSSWKDQFIEAITIQLDDDDDELDEDGEPKPPRQPTYWDYTAHSLTIVWKVLFAFVPPTEYLNGWLCFWTSIIMIGVLTAIIGDLSSHLGCSVGLKDTITAIAFVALGTSIPDTFASKVAAINDKYADSSIGNVTGSNAVNVFLGIGIAWTMAALVKSHRGERFEVNPGSLGFSVAIFCICAAICCTVLIIRRFNKTA